MNVPRVFTQTHAACGAVIEKEGKILLVHENLPGNPDDGKWSHPAGWIDVGDNPLETVRKEVKEETGHEFAPTYVIGIYSIVRGDLASFWGATPHGVKIIFTGTIGEYSENNLLGDTRGTKWFLPEEIYAMNQNILRDTDIKQIVKDYFSGKRYPLEIITHTIMTGSGSEGFVFRGKVIHGKGRGKALGFPTANLDVADISLGFGVYLVEVEVLGKKYRGLLHFGAKETFNEEPSLEIFIKDLARDIYGETVAVRVMKKIRETQKFDNPHDLQKQIARDVKKNLS